jgi:hypothetical protein
MKPLIWVTERTMKKDDFLPKADYFNPYAKVLNSIFKDG